MVDSCGQADAESEAKQATGAVAETAAEAVAEAKAEVTAEAGCGCSDIWLKCFVLSDL